MNTLPEVKVGKLGPYASTCETGRSDSESLGAPSIPFKPMGREKSPRTICHKEPLTPVPCPCPAGPFPARNHLTGGRDEVPWFPFRVPGVEPLKLLLAPSSSNRDSISW